MTSDAGPIVCTCAAVRRAARHLTQGYDRWLAPSGLRVTQYNLLAQLCRRDPVNVQTLARALGMDRTTLGRNLQPLEREQLVAVTTSPDDRRGRLIEITAAGQARFAAAQSLWRQAQDHVETGFGAHATGTLHSLLEALQSLPIHSGPA